MANLILTKIGMSRYLSWALRLSTPGSSRQIVMFKNNITVGSPTVLANLVSPTFPGYADFTLTSGYSGATDDGTYLICQAPPHIFACTATPGAAETMYGYGIVHNSTDLLWVQNFATPRVINAVGNAIAIEHFDRHTGNVSGGSGQPAVATVSHLTDAVLLGTSQGVSDSSFQMGLFVNSPTQSRTNVAGDFTEPGYTGYSRQSVSGWGAPTDISAGTTYRYQSLGSPLTFQPSSGWTGSETVNGYFLVGNNTGDVKWSQYISPITLTSDFSFVYIVPSLQLGTVYYI